MSGTRLRVALAALVFCASCTRSNAPALETAALREVPLSASQTQKQITADDVALLKAKGLIPAGQEALVQALVRQ